MNFYGDTLSDLTGRLSLGALTRNELESSTVFTVGKGPTAHLTSKGSLSILASELELM